MTSMFRFGTDNDGNRAVVPRHMGTAQCAAVLVAVTGVGLVARSVPPTVPSSAVYVAAFGLFLSIVCVLARKIARSSAIWVQVIHALPAAVTPTALLMMVGVALVAITGVDVEGFGLVAGDSCAPYLFPSSELVVAAAIVFGAAAAEEFIFRHWLPTEVRRSLNYGWRHRRLSNWTVSAIASQATFAASHVLARSVIVGEWQFSITVVASQFTFGMLLYAIAEQSGGLSAPIAIHTIYNWVVGPLGPSERLCPGPAALLAASVVVTAAALPWLRRAIPTGSR